MPDKLKIKLPPLAFLICLIISAVAWFLVAFSKDYHVTMDFRVVCYNLPEGKESVTVSDSILSLTFNQKGLKYLTQPFSDKDRVLYLSVKDLVKPKGKASVYTVSNRDLREFMLNSGVFGSELVAVEAPEVVTFYVR